MRPTIKLVVLALLLTAAPDAGAERPPQDKSVATNVVTGTVQKLTQTEEKFGADGVQTDYVAAVKVEQAERGAGVRPGDVITVHWFAVTKTPSRPFPGAYGHKYGVMADDRIRAYLIKRGTGTDYDVIYNSAGIEKLTGK
jgi:hypothetical protein